MSIDCEYLFDHYLAYIFFLWVDLSDDDDKGSKKLHNICKWASNPLVSTRLLHREDKSSMDIPGVKWFTTSSHIYVSQNILEPVSRKVSSTLWASSKVTINSSSSIPNEFLVFGSKI